MATSSSAIRMEGLLRLMYGSRISLRPGSAPGISLRSCVLLLSFELRSVRDEDGGKLHASRGAAAVTGDELQGPAVRGGEAARDLQAEAEALARAGVLAGRPQDAAVVLELARHRRRDARPAVAHLDGDHLAGGRRRELDRAAAAGGARGVLEQVDDDLERQRRVDGELRAIGGDTALEAALGEQRRQALGGGAEEPRRRHRLDVQTRQAGLEPGQRQQVVDAPREALLLARQSTHRVQRLLVDRRPGAVAVARRVQLALERLDLEP